MQVEEVMVRLRFFLNQYWANFATLHFNIDMNDVVEDWNNEYLGHTLLCYISPSELYWCNSTSTQMCAVSF